MKCYSILVFFILHLSCYHAGDNEDENIFNGNFPIVEIIINEFDTARFLVDTGADICIIDSTFYRRKQYSHSSFDTLQVHGGAGLPAKEIVCCSGFSFIKDDKEYNGLDFYIYDVKEIIPEIDGVIGSNFLHDKVLLIDYDKGFVDFLHDEAGIQSYGFTDTLDIQFLQKSPVVKIPYIKAIVYISDLLNYNGEFIIDTGSKTDITFWQSVADSLCLTSINKKKYKLSRENGNISGEMQGFIFRADSVHFPPFIYHAPIIYFESNENYTGKNQYKSFRSGVIGNGILSKYLIALDYKKSKLYYKRIQENKTKAFLHSGITLGMKRQGAEVVGLIYGSPADIAGVRVGDVLLKIDTINVSSDNISDVSDMLKSAGTYRLKLKRNDSIFEKQVPVKKLL
jgi:hypothetical protein